MTGPVSKALNFKLSTMNFGQFVMLGNRIIIPDVLKEQVIKLVHEGHQSIVQRRKCLKSKVWWPEMDKMTEKEMKECYLGQVVRENVSPEKLRSMALPDKPCSYPLSL